MIFLEVKYFLREVRFLEVDGESKIYRLSRSAHSN